jgi:hypothetical protein
MTFLGRKLNGKFQGDLVADPARLLLAAAAPARPSREAPHEAQLDQNVQQGRLGAARRDADRLSLSGRRTMAAALKLRDVAYPSLYADAA